MASAPTDPGGGLGTPVSQAVSAANRFLRRITAVSTPPMSSAEHQHVSPSLESTSLRPAHTSEPQQQPQQPLAITLVSPTATSRRSTDPDGSTGDEAIAASLRAYATIAQTAIEVEMEEINEIRDTLKEDDDDVSAMTTSLPSTTKKLEPVESLSASPHGRKKTEPTMTIIPDSGATAHIIPKAVSPPLVYDFPSTDIPWITIINHQTRLLVLDLPSKIVDDIQRDMNRYANGDDSPKNIAMAEYLFTKASNEFHPPPSLENASSNGGSISTNNSIMESLSKVNDNMSMISLRLTNPSSDRVLTHDDKQVMNSKYGDFEMLPQAFTYESMCKWKLRIANRLNSPPWKLDGVSILDMKDMEDASDRYKLRTNKLCNHLHDIMMESGLDSMSMQLQPTISKVNQSTDYHYFFIPSSAASTSVRKVFLVLYNDVGNVTILAFSQSPIHFLLFFYTYIIQICYGLICDDLYYIRDSSFPFKIIIAVAVAFRIEEQK
ncbi:hypothetical protein FRACYDRAFT_247372 [Fragilariopsis cylindrus CCMP1102]|uniref:Uncharacterized protein n=1 Tax=Fragilariopsis cylindrus CCMP1102 TaxID=635003 RepID=A0A1E7EX05_9STRA|nr:hypothetical protein FRACYDRAFT_247372 [Fragilariopsis cylindrus CCMP1102]|eukprot:OEU10344.1 hypothetical protein FRACYDRAFT_247372 [Fragilariopsis cylindrus CCMP1102]